MEFKRPRCTGAQAWLTIARGIKNDVKAATTTSWSCIGVGYTYWTFGCPLAFSLAEVQRSTKDNHHVQPLPHRTQVSRSSHGHHILYPAKCPRPRARYHWLFPAAEPASDASQPQDWWRQEHVLYRGRASCHGRFLVLLCVYREHSRRAAEIAARY